MALLEEFLKTIDRNLVAKLQVPPEGSESPLALAQRRGLLKPEDFVLDHAAEKKFFVAWNDHYGVYADQKKREQGIDINWTTEEKGVAIACSLAYASAFQARGKLSEAVTRQRLALDKDARSYSDDTSVLGQTTEIDETLEALQMPINRLSTSIITRNIYDTLTTKGLDVMNPETNQREHKTFDKDTASQFIGSIVKISMNAYRDVAGKDVEIAVFPLLIAPDLQKKPFAILAEDIKIAPAGETVKVKNLLAQINALEEKSMARA